MTRREIQRHDTLDTYGDVSWGKCVNAIPNYTTEDGSVVGDAGKRINEYDEE